MAARLRAEKGRHRRRAFCDGMEEGHAAMDAEEGHAAMAAGEGSTWLENVTKQRQQAKLMRNRMMRCEMHMQGGYRACMGTG